MGKIILIILILLSSSSTYGADIDLDLDSNSAVDIAHGGTNRTSLSTDIQTFLGSANYAAMTGLPYIPSTTMTAAADMIVGGTAGAPARLAKGAANSLLGMNSDATAQEYKTSITGVGINLGIPSGPTVDTTFGRDSNYNLTLGISGTSTNTFMATLDEDTMTSNSATKTATQQSIKAYVDTQNGTRAPASTELDGHASGSLSLVAGTDTVVFNTGMGAADVVLVLPTAAANMSALFTVGTAQSNKWGVQAGTNDKIYLIAADGTVSAGADNGYARMTNAQVGQSFACWSFKTDAYDWMCKSIAVGSSTFAAN